MENSVPFSLWVAEALESYFECKKHEIEVHLVLGTQRLLELVDICVSHVFTSRREYSYPVSNMTLKDCGGVPISISA